MRTCVIFNPKARGQKAEGLKKLLENVTGSCHQKPTTFAGEARRLAETAVVEGYDTIVAAGGDGTINEVLNGIIDAPQGLEKVRLGVLPLGTMNVFARELKISSGIKSAWNIILEGVETAIDLPCVTYWRGGTPVTRSFAQLAGAGLDSRAVELVSWELKKKIGALAYVVAGLKALASKQSRILVTMDGTTLLGEMVLIGNGRLYGGNFILFPRADLRDGHLDVCVFPKINWQILARAGLGMATNRLHQLCGVQEFRTTSVMLSSTDPTSLQLDGETVGVLPATFSIGPKKLRVLVP